MKSIFALFLVFSSLTAFAQLDYTVATCTDGVREILRFQEITPGKLGLGHHLILIERGKKITLTPSDIVIVGGDMSIEYKQEGAMQNKTKLSFDRSLGQIKKKFNVQIERTVTEENSFMSYLFPLKCKMKRK